MSSVRMVRPRPLADDDRIPVFWPGREPGAELKQVDGGALYSFLQAQQAEAGPSGAGGRRGAAAGGGRQRKRPRRGDEGAEPQPPRVVAGGAISGGVASGSGSLGGAVHRRHAITVPGVRDVPDYDLNRAALVVQAPSAAAAARSDPALAPYVRYAPPLPGAADEALGGEYDLDEEDEAFLARLYRGALSPGPSGFKGAKGGKAAAGSKGSRDGQGGAGDGKQRSGSSGGGGGSSGGGANGDAGGLMAAAVGLYRSLSNRFKSSSGGGSAPAPEQPAVRRRGAAVTGVGGGRCSCQSSGAAAGLLSSPCTATLC